MWRYPRVIRLPPDSWVRIIDVVFVWITTWGISTCHLTHGSGSVDVVFVRIITWYICLPPNTVRINTCCETKRVVAKRCWHLRKGRRRPHWSPLVNQTRVSKWRGVDNRKASPHATGPRVMIAGWGGWQKRDFCSYVSSIWDEELRPTYFLWKAMLD